MAHAEALRFELPPANTEATRFERTLTGQLVIEPDGRVSEVVLDALDPPLREPFIAAIRQWRFHPVEQDGQAIRARAAFQIAAFAETSGEGGAWRLGVENVWFRDDPAGSPGGAAQSSALHPPKYPTQAARNGHGARVDVVVKLDGSGRVVDAAVAALALQGAKVGRHGTAGQSLQLFSESALKAARGWTIRDASAIAQGSAVVPVTFSPLGVTEPGERWMPVIPVPLEPSHEAAALAAEAVALGQGGMGNAAFRLLADVAGTYLN
jgi:hypothetical protein